jgi:Fe-S-cluster containining protein
LSSASSRWQAAADRNVRAPGTGIAAKQVHAYIQTLLNGSINSNAPAPEDLCLKCGLCCNGVIFADVKLQPADDAPRLRSLGVSVSIPHSAFRTPHLNQPCAALEGCRCRIYAERPQYCRQFECLLLKSVKAGRTQPAAALRKINTARERAEKVRVLLRTLGDADEHLALSARFRRVARRMNKTELDPRAATAYGKLTLAVQDLNLLLSQSFYPGNLGREG